MSRNDDTRKKNSDGWDEKLSSFFRQKTPGIMGRRRFFAILAPMVVKEGKTHFLFELRSAHIDRQPGEVCFPGGEMEPGETFSQCAVRETMEELGIPEEKIKVITEIDTIYNFNGAEIHCFLGSIDAEDVEKAQINEDEVEKIFTVPVEYFMENDPDDPLVLVHVTPPEDFPFEDIGFKGGYNWITADMEVPIFKYEGNVVWGLMGRVVLNMVRQFRAGAEDTEKNRGEEGEGS